jgi:hypothetical protein
MSHQRLSHIGRSTLDLHKTREFYECGLAFKPVMTIEEGGRLRHLCRARSTRRFLGARGVLGIPTDYDAGINRGLGITPTFYHCLQGRFTRCPGAEERRTAHQGPRHHRYRRSPMGAVDLLQSFQRPVPQVLLRCALIQQRTTRQMHGAFTVRRETLELGNAINIDVSSAKPARGERKAYTIARLAAVI